ncbi:MAG: hypothetical protein K2H09_08100 [Treponemataceae bacterium]|nr:hypothetical protein [Treponemataceae bacterium]
MKRKLGMFLFSCLLVLLITSCDEVLSVVTPGENGEKVVNNYVSMLGDKVYDESVSMKTWNDIDIFEDEDIVAMMDNLLFKIENDKERIVVLGDKDTAVEISFFDGGYTYTVFSSMESLNRMFN